ncbi:alpha/beta fold hydrolase [Actinomyces howellii]|nr:alpha/beta fold hydrolase [Actinomyces howellii]
MRRSLTCALTTAACLTLTATACQPLSPSTSTDPATAAATEPAAAASTSPSQPTPQVDSPSASPSPAAEAASSAPAEPAPSPSPAAEAASSAPAEPVASPSPAEPTSQPSSQPTSQPSSQVPSGLETFYAQELAWGECSDGSSGYQCATLTVPLDYSDPSGQTITVALKRLPASDGHAENGSLFLNPGGPGGSGLSYLTEVTPFLPADLLASYDVIGFDPRGVGASTPITCWSSEDLASVEAGTPGYAPVDDGALTEAPELDTSPQSEAEAETAPAAAGDTAEAAVSDGREAAALCEQHSEVPELLDHMDATTVARDMDVMRDVVGDERLAYLGVSYGTYLGSVYAEQFPGNVGRFVLDSAMDPALTRAEIHEGNMSSKESTVHAYVESCLGSGQCPLSGTTQEAVAQLTAFLDGLDASPLSVAGSATGLNRATTVSLIHAFTTDDPQYWPHLTQALTPALTEHNGTELVTQANLLASAGQNEADDSEATRPIEDVLTAMWNSEYALLAVHCSDYPETGDLASWDAQAAELRAAYPISYDKTGAYMDAFCHGWGHGSGAREPAAVSAEGSGPILVVGNTLDHRTPYAWAEDLVGQLDNGHLLTVEAAIHGQLGANTCSTGQMSEFLVTGALPEAGQTCPADPLPPLEG